MIKTCEFHVEHLGMMKKRDVYKAYTDLNERYAALSSSQGVFMYTVFDGDSPIAIVGGNLVWEGFLTCWGILSDAVTKHPIAFTKEIRRLIRVHIEELKLYRLSMEVKADYLMGVRWANALGFECEGTMKKWGPDKSDYCLFARVM
jgi:hypothetical protein